MKNNIYKYLILIFLYFCLPIKSNSSEQFNFDITNVEILEMEICLKVKIKE